MNIEELRQRVNDLDRMKAPSTIGGTLDAIEALRKARHDLADAIAAESNRPGPSQALLDAMATQEAINRRREASLRDEEERARAPRDQAVEQPVLPRLMRLRVKPGEGSEITPYGEDEPRRTLNEAGYGS